MIVGIILCLTLFLLGVRVGMEVAAKIYGVRKERGKGEILVEEAYREMARE